MSDSSINDSDAIVKGIEARDGETDFAALNASVLTGGNVLASGDVLAGAEIAEIGMRVVSARGTEDGFVLRIDGKAEWTEILSEIRSFLDSRRRFLEGGEVSVEWLERLPTREQSQELETYLRDEFGITICARRKKPSHTMITVEGGSPKRAKPTTPLFEESPTLDHHEMRSGAARPLDEPVKDEGRGRTIRIGAARSHGGRTTQKDPTKFSNRDGEGRRDMKQSGDDDYELAVQERFRLERSSRTRSEFDPAAVLSIDKERSAEGAGGKYASNVARLLGDDVQFDEDANAKIVFGTLRSGQRIETPFSLVVVGDVNPGADLVAGGDIVVLGSLRGTAHAAAYDDECQDRVVFALQMQPMQLRIGSVISRGSGEVGGHPEVARVENRRIVVDAYNSRSAQAKKLR